MQQFNMKQKEEYKETELGLLPESWKVVKLEDIADVSSGGSAPQGKKYFEGNRPFIRVKHINNEDYIIKKYDLITENAVKDYKLKLFSKGTIVFPKSGASVYLEKRAILPLNAYIVSHLCAVNSNKNIILQDFLFYFLINKKLAQKKADAYPTLNISEIKKVIISFPLLLEQKKIANVLSTIQEAKEKTENVINSLKELKKSMMKHLFAYGPVSLEEAENVKLKDTEIGMVPEEWESTKLGHIFKEVNHKIKNTEIDKNNIPILSMTRYKGLILQKMKFGKRVASRDILNYKIIKKGQLAYGFPMDEGVIYFLKDYDLGAVSPAYLTWDLVDERIDKDYLDFLLKSPALIEKYKGLSSTTVHRRRIVNKNDFRNITIYFPSLSEQKQIVLILLILEESIEKEKNKKNTLEELFKSMLHNLITAKIRVNNLEI